MALLSMRCLAICLLSSHIAGFSTSLLAQDPSAVTPNSKPIDVPVLSNAAEKEKDASSAAEKKVPDTTLKSSTNGSVTIDGKEIRYEAITDTVVLLNDKNEPSASVFYVFYKRIEAGESFQRPLVFCFNGGPGSSSVWLHLGGLGPKRVVLPDDGIAISAPPFTLEDSPDSPLDIADLVFVDPVNTGFSRTEKNADPSPFLGYNEDVRYLSEFVRRFVSDNQRWASPKYLLGESYGAMRVAAMADQVQESYGMYLNGIVLLSGLLDFQTLLTEGNNELPYICALPSMAATAHFHGLAGKDKEVIAHMQEAREFAFGPYANALLAGNTLEEKPMAEIAAKLQTLTAIPAQTWLNAKLRIPPAVFRKQLLAARAQEIGRFDTRIISPSVDLISPYTSGDASLSLVWGPFSSTINDYLGRTLKASAPFEYEVLSSDSRRWDFGTENGFMEVGNRLSSAMTSNPKLRVLVQSGHYDLATPRDAILHSMARLALPKEALNNISLETYEGGHMFYTNRPASRKMREDLVRFFR